MAVGGAATAIGTNGEGCGVDEAFRSLQSTMEQLRLLTGMDIVADLAGMATSMFHVEINGTLAEAGSGAVLVGNAAGVVAGETEGICFPIERNLKLGGEVAEQQLTHISAVNRVALAALAGRNRLVD